MRALLLAALAALLPFLSQAATPQVRWAVSSYGTSGGTAALGCGGCASDQRSMQVDAAGNVIASGFSDNGATLDDFKTVKYDGATGAILWEKSFGSANGYDQAWGMGLDAAGNAIVTGAAWNGTDFDFKVIKYAAADGAIAWQATIVGPGGGLDAGLAVVTDAAGNAIVGGYTNNGMNDDMRTIKFAAANGDVLWDKTFAGVANGNDYVFAMAVDGAGNVVVTGENVNASSDWKTIKYAAADGAILWQASFDGASGGLDIPYSIAIDAANNVIIAGDSHNGTNFDARIFKLAANDGAALWQKTFAGAANGDDIFYSVALDQAGNAIAAGFSFSGATSNDWKIVKYRAADGEVLWDQSLSGSGNLSDVSVTVAIDAAGNAVAGGRINNSADPANRDMHVAKFAAADGALLWSYTHAGTAGAFDRVAAVVTRPGVVFVAGESAETGAQPGWRIVKLSETPNALDFNDDGRPDLLWSNTSNGATYAWYMNGTALLADALIATIDPSWQVQGVADFNGDGRPDLVWRNNADGATYVWYMNGPTLVSDAYLFSLPTEWVIQGVADFNADGRPDFLMRNTSTGVAFAWYFNDATAIGDNFLFGIDASWKVEAVADMNNDGQPDLMFRNMASGLAFVWNTQFSAGVTSLAGSAPPLFSIDPVWEVVQLADWNADGTPDLVFRNSASGLVFVWYTVGGALAGSDLITQIDPSWEIVPRR